MWSNGSARRQTDEAISASLARLVLQPRLGCLRCLLTRCGALPARTGWAETRPLPRVRSPPLLWKRKMLCTQCWCLIVSTARTGFHPDGCSSLLHKASVSYVRVADQLTELLCNWAVTPWHRLAVSLGLLQHYAVIIIIIIFFYRDDRFSYWFNIFFL